jgi:chromosome segregation ATPase
MSNTPAVAEARRDEAQAKIQRKIDVLSQWAEHGAPEDAFVPASENQFRTWQDEELGLEPIGSKGTLNQPHNRVLKREANRLLDLLQKNTQRKEQRRDSRRERTERLATELETVKVQLADMATRYSAERDEARRARREALSLRQRIADLQEDRAALVQRLRELEDIPRITGGE